VISGLVSDIIRVGALQSNMFPTIKTFLQTVLQQLAFGEAF